MYSYNYSIPNNNQSMYEKSDNLNKVPYYSNNDERFLWAPFIFGGLAGTALGYGIANNNQLNSNGQCCNGGLYYNPYYNPYYQPYYNNGFPTYNNNYYY